MTVTETEIAAVAVGPRVTKKDLEANIASYVIFNAVDAVHGCPVSESLNLLTLAIITTNNGFTVTGQSACAYPENYDQEIGERLALADAKNKLWALMSYELKSKVAITLGSGLTFGDNTYFCSKAVNATPLNRRDYNIARGWTLPSNEDGDDEGYVHTDGFGHTQWTPKETFERDFRKL